MNQRLIVICLLWMVVTNYARGDFNSFGVVYTNGNGYVYVSEEEKDMEAINAWTDSVMYLWDSNEKPPEGTPYWIYAKPDEGYQFEGWKYFKFSNPDDLVIFSSNPKQRIELSNNRAIAYFKPIEDPKLSGVPRGFNVFVDNEKVERDGNSNYFIAEGKPVRIEWGRLCQCDLEPETSHQDEMFSFSFIMPEYDITLKIEDLPGALLSGVPASFDVFVEGHKIDKPTNGIYVIPDGMMVRIEWGQGYRCKLDPEIYLDEEGEHSMTFRMPYDPLALIAIEEVFLNSSDNSTAISNRQYKTCDVMLLDCNLWKDGFWNTLCLPFDYPVDKDPLTGATIVELYNASYEGNTNTLTMDFTDVYDKIEAGKPYLIKWEAGDPLNTPKFDEVIFTSTEPTNVSKGDVVTFKGSYGAVGFNKNPKMLYLGEMNMLYYPDTDMTLNAFKAYFELLGGLVCGEPSLDGGVNTFVLNCGGAESVVFSIENGKLKWAKEDDNWYTLDGRKLQGVPTAKGIFINKNNKVIIK